MKHHTSHPCFGGETREMKFFVLLLAIGLTTADKLDRTYLPPPGSTYSGGQPGDLQAPLDYSNGFSTTGRPQGSLATRFPSSSVRPQGSGDGPSLIPAYNQESIPSSTVATQNLNRFSPGTDRPFSAQKTYNIPTTTTSYAFSQTTTYSPIEGIEDGNAEGIPGNQGQFIVDQNGNVVKNIPQQVGFTTGTGDQQAGFQFQPGTSSIVGSKGQPIIPGGIIDNQLSNQNGITPGNTLQYGSRYGSDKQTIQPTQTLLGFGGNVPNTGVSPANVVYDQNGNPVQTKYGFNVLGQPTTGGPINYPSTLTLFNKNGNPTAVQFDQNGNIIPKIYYDQNRKPVIVKIDQNRNIIPESLYDRSGNPAIVTYDKDGNFVPQTLYDQNGNPVFVNKNGSVGTQFFYDRNGKPTSLIYDKNGKIVPQLYYNQNGKPITVKFDLYGNILPEMLYDQNGNPAKINYDQNGRIVPQTFFNENGKPLQLDQNGNILGKNLYDQNGNPISKNYGQDKSKPQIIYNNNGKPVVVDENGNIIQEKLFDQYGNPAGIKYDQKGNIVPQTFYDQNGKPLSVKQNEPTQQPLFDQNGNPALAKYDQNGNIVQETFYDKYGKPIPVQIDQSGMIIAPNANYQDGVPTLTPTQYPISSPIAPNIAVKQQKYGIDQPFIRPERPQAEADRNAYIVNYENVLTPEGFSYSFDTSNGIHADETGTAIDGVKAQGAYSYIGDDGKEYSVIYSADENGFLPRGDHLPTPPPIPQAILRVIEEAKKAKEAGIINDGSYDDSKYGYKKYQGPMERYRPSNRNRTYDANGNIIKRPDTSSSTINNPDDRIDYIEEDINDKGDTVPGYRKEQGLPNRGYYVPGNANNRDYTDVISDDDRQLTKGTQRVSRPRIPGQQPSNKIVQSDSGKEFEVTNNPDGSISVVPISGTNQLGISKSDQFGNKQSTPEQGFSPIGTDNLRIPQSSYEQEQILSNNRRPQNQGSDTTITYGVNDRPTSQYKGYEYLAPVKAFEIGGNDKVGTFNRPAGINRGSSTAKPFVMQPDDGDALTSPRPGYQGTLITDTDSPKSPDEFVSQQPSQTAILNGNAPISSIYPQSSQSGTKLTPSNLAPAYASTYKPITSTELDFGDKITPGTTPFGSTGSTPATRIPISQDNYPSTTYRPKYSIVKGSQGENILVDEYGQPANLAQSYSGTPAQGAIGPSYAVTQRIPGPDVTFDDTGRPVQTGTQPGSSAVTPQIKVDAFGRPLPQTVDAYGRPIAGSDQANLVPGSPDYDSKRPAVIPSQPFPVTPGPQQQQVTVDQFGRPVVPTYPPGTFNQDTFSTKDGQNGIAFSPAPTTFKGQSNQVIGESFSGPQQKQMYDPKTGYYY